MEFRKHTNLFHPDLQHKLKWQAHMLGCTDMLQNYFFRFVFVLLVFLFKVFFTCGPASNLFYEPYKKKCRCLPRETRNGINAYRYMKKTTRTNDKRTFLKHNTCPTCCSNSFSHTLHIRCTYVSCKFHIYTVIYASHAYHTRACIC